MVQIAMLSRNANSLLNLHCICTKFSLALLLFDEHVSDIDSPNDLLSRQTQQDGRQSALVILDYLAFPLVNLMIPVPESGIERFDDGLDLLAQRRPNLLLHVQALVARDHLVEAGIEGLELLLLLVLFLAAEALDDSGAVAGGAGDGPIGYGDRVGFRVDLVEEMDGDFFPSVHVQGRGLFAPLVEFGGARR